jgi:hypothetical protein
MNTSMTSGENAEAAKIAEAGSISLKDAGKPEGASQKDGKKKRKREEQNSKSRDASEEFSDDDDDDDEI